MRHGDFASAWRVSDAVLRARTGQPCWHLPRHHQPVWDGTPLTGRRVLVRCHHGLGDTIQFIRYAPFLHAVASEVVVWAQPELVPLVERVRGVDRVLPLHDGAPDVDRDVDVEVMELPWIFRTTLRTVPAEVPYLHVAPPPPPNDAHDGALRVGLVWRAGDWDVDRSIPFPLLAPLAGVPGVALHVLQRGSGLAEWREGFGAVAGTDVVPAAARMMAGLDLIVSVDSMPAHLAGALGRPTWTLLRADADWRWMTAREDSPWYPTMRLFRQEREGEWEPLVERVASELRRLAAGRSTARSS
jgi:hypothetical protein